MNPSPYDKLLDQIAELMQFAYDNAHKPVSFEKAKDMEAKLDALEKKVQEFKQLSDSIIKGSGLTDFTFQNMIEDTSALVPEETREVLQRAENLKSEAKKASQNPLAAAKEAKESGKRLTGKKKKEKVKSPQARKGKFKSMGGYKNWKPL